MGARRRAGVPGSALGARASQSTPNAKRRYSASVCARRQRPLALIATSDVDLCLRTL